MKNTCGLSLIEVIIGVFILLLGFLFLMGVFPESFWGIGRARNLQFANNLAQENMESFAAWYSVGAVGVPPGGGTGTQSINDEVSGSSVNTQFTWQVVGSPDCNTGNNCPTQSCACPGSPQPYTDYNVVHLISWVRWQELQGSLITAPNGAPSNISSGYGAHFHSVETWVYLP